MKKSKIFKFLGFLIAIIIPFTSVACNSDNASSFNTISRTPKYLLTGTQAGTSGDYVYYSIDNDTAYAVALTESARNDTGSKTIPSTYNDKPVTGIWRSAFFNSHCTSVTIPSGITVIDYEAFMGCNITTVTIPASVSEIGECAFYSCKSLKKAAIQNSSTTSDASSACSCIDVVESGSEQRTYSTLKTIPALCFFNCISLKELVLPESIEDIEYEAFYNNYSLFSTLTFMNIKAIRSRAFQKCSALTKVYISSSFFEKDENQKPIGVIEEKAFEGCGNLEFYLIGAENDVLAWINLAGNNNWNRKSEFANPGTQISPDATGTNRYTYHITASGASYSNDWIYTIDQNNDVEITSYIGPTDIEGVSVKFLSFPDELPSGSGNKVRSIALNALDTVKATVQRLYLPKHLKRLNSGQFGADFTNLIVVDDNTTCGADETLAQANQDLTPRIILNGLTELEVIGNSAFVNLPKLTLITKLYLPYSLKAVGANAFGTSATDNKHLTKVTDFRWDYDDDNSALLSIGKEAFYKIGNSDTGKGITGGVHKNYLAADGTENYKLTTLVFPRTFKYFGINDAINNTYNVGGSETNDANFGKAAFAGSPLIEKVVFKGSKKSVVQSATTSTNDSATVNLVIPTQTFVMNESLRTVVFEERCGKSIFFHTAGGTYQPSIGWTSGKSNNDFNGDPGLQTLVLPNKYTQLYVQNFAFQGNSRGAIYFSAGTTNKIKGSSVALANTVISNPGGSSYNITDTRVKAWRTIGDEDFYTIGTTNVCPGYALAGSNNDPTASNQNHFGIDQKMPVYGSVLYTDTISKPGISVDVEVGTGNTTEYVVKDKCSFVCSGSNATMTNYLFDRHDSSFSGTAVVPATVNKAGGGSCTVNTIGASAFSAAYCDGNSYNGYTNYKTLTAISIPDTISTIEEYAFMRAYDVTKVSSYNVSTNQSNGDYVMPSSLAHIGKHAFAFCKIKQVLNIPTNCLFYENENATSYETSVFANNFALRKVTFGNGATSSTYYTTTSYTHSNVTYTSAIYSKDTVTYNASSLLIVLNRDSNAYKDTSADLTIVPTQVGNQTVNYAEFNGQYAAHYLYGAFKMCYWVDSLIVGTANDDSLSQPLISGINSTIYLNKTFNFVNSTCALKTISFGNATTIATPAYSFSGCEQLVNIKLPQIDGGTIPEGLFASIGGSNVVFEVPENAAASSYKKCDPGVLDLTYTKYSTIDADAFKNTGIKEIIAPITTDFTIESNAFANCASLTSIDFSNVTGTVTLNGAFRGATISSSSIFNYGSSAKIKFGAETFKGATFSDKTFVFPAKTALIGTSCFEGCTTLENVSAAADLTELERVVVDSESGKNNYNFNNNVGFKQIGDYAFYKCTNLKNFDFTNFSELERIGHYAFSMANKMSGTSVQNDKEGDSNSACICTNGIVNLPASLTNLGVGVFHSSKIVQVTINSSTMLFERGKDYTNDVRAQYNKGGAQFRFCKSLTKVAFSNPNCAWRGVFLTKAQGDQSTYFANCTALTEVYLPTGFNLQYSGYTGDTDATRSDSMCWDSNTGMKFYVYHTVHDLVASPAISKYWHRMSNSATAPIVFYVNNNLDVVKLANNTYSEIRGKAEYWTIYNGTPVYLGTAKTINSTTGLVTFSVNGGYTADASGVHKA